MAVEKYIAAASLGLFVMFTAEIITIYHFMMDPDTIAEIFEPEPKLLQFISIGVAPAAIMAGVSYIMSRRYGSKIIGGMILAGGAVMLVGMIFVHGLLDQIKPEFLLDTIKFVPIVFIIVSIPVMVFGALLFRIKKRHIKKDYLT